MRLTVFNGSPRGEDSNTKVILDHFLNGFMKTKGNRYELSYLVRTNERDDFVKSFQEAEHVLLAFPLYVGAMPAIVKTFIETLVPLVGRDGNPDIGFIVQSGFPEAIHSRYVERYVEKLARRLGCHYLGTVVRGGGEAIRAMPAWFNKKLLDSFYKLGEAFGEKREFDERIVLDIAKPERFSKAKFWYFRIVVQKFYWDRMLRKNNAFRQRFARPYVE